MNQVEQAVGLLEEVLVPHVETALQRQWGEGWRLAVSGPQAEGAPWDLPALADTIRGNPGLFDRELQKQVKALLPLWSKWESLSGRQASDFVGRVRALTGQLAPGTEEELLTAPPGGEPAAEEQLAPEEEELAIEEEPEAEGASVEPPRPRPGARTVSARASVSSRPATRPRSAPAPLAPPAGRREAATRYEEYRPALSPRGILRRPLLLVEVLLALALGLFLFCWDGYNVYTDPDRRSGLAATFYRGDWGCPAGVYPEGVLIVPQFRPLYYEYGGTPLGPWLLTRLFHP